MKKKRKRTSHEVTLTLDENGDPVVIPEVLGADKRTPLTQGDIVTFSAIGTNAVILNPHSPRNPNIKGKKHKKKKNKYLADPEVLYVRKNKENKVEFRIRSDTKAGEYQYTVFSRRARAPRIGR